MWRGSGAGAKGGGTSAADAATADAMEKQNDALMNSLSSKVDALKNITISINNEVNEQNKELDQMQTGMGAAGGLFDRTMKGVTTMFSSHGNQSIALMSGIAVTAFLLIWVLVRVRA
mmetsp:Transcript_8407/g.19849  ORF Transcript_8407/g.19849 Transcript_8407/m.19849 type:complete len:117 (+) Transcript_8407:3-353(+)